MIFQIRYFYPTPHPSLLRIPHKISKGYHSVWVPPPSLTSCFPLQIALNNRFCKILPKIAMKALEMRKHVLTPRSIYSNWPLFNKTTMLSKSSFAYASLVLNFNPHNIFITLAGSLKILLYLPPISFYFIHYSKNLLH